MLPAIVRRWMANEPVVVWSCVIGGIGMSVLVCFVLLCFCDFVCLKVGITCGLLVLPTLRLCLTPSLL